MALVDQRSSDDPLILVVEDDPRNRAAKLRFFELNGFRAISAESRQDAERELRACPLVDMIVTDVNLDVRKPRDTSGLDLAQNVRQAFPTLPLIGYSGHFEDGALPKESVALFDSIQLKGGDWVNFGRTHLPMWRDRATTYRSQRRDHAGQELLRLNSKYGFSSHDLELLREFVPGGGLGDLAQAKGIEGVLRQSGYRLRMIEKGSTHSSTTNGKPVLRRPISVWVRTVAGITRSEVYGFPILSAEATSEDEVLQKILSLMEGYYRDSTSADEATDVPPELVGYLKLVFE